MLGLLKVKVIRGINLAYRDTKGSDPYVVLRFGRQKLKTSVKKSNVNPEWNEYLTLSISEPIHPIRIEVFDKDTFTRDDEMGDAEFGIRPLVDCAQMSLEDMADGSVIRSVLPYRHNCLLKESPIVWKDGTLTQDVALKLRNVESGEIELQLQWVQIPSSAHSL
ncbi:putative Ca2+-dependent phospholipid-binding protein [Dioscorea alata]|uniref:Ca2+-dependent phospholipid-binding protein n=1 Tax=Dioscorea alata TaxID=55571 RepID=A0ACB7UNC9_DIOAL|nr:putative Ca2+-dependent phospholipid-binding protein [Dioscorea alata]